MRISYALVLCTIPCFLFNGPTAEAQRRIDRFTPGQGAAIRQATIRLVNELEHLQENLSLDLQSPESRRWFRQVDEILEGALHFQRSVEAERDREHLYRDYQWFDERLHEFFRTFQTSRAGRLQRNVDRVHYADDQLHQALSIGDHRDDRRREVIARQAHSLDREAQYLAQLADRVLADGVFRGRQRPQPLRRAIRDFADAAKHFHDAVERSNDPRHIRGDFSQVGRSWEEVVRLMNSSHQSAFLFRQSRRIGEIYEELNRRLASEGDRHRHAPPPPLEFRFRRGN